MAWRSPEMSSIDLKTPTCTWLQSGCPEHTGCEKPHLQAYNAVAYSTPVLQLPFSSTGSGAHK